MHWHSLMQTTTVFVAEYPLHNPLALHALTLNAYSPLPRRRNSCW